MMFSQEGSRRRSCVQPRGLCLLSLSRVWALMMGNKPPKERNFQPDSALVHSIGVSVGTQCLQMLSSSGQLGACGERG